MYVVCCIFEGTRICEFLTKTVKPPLQRQLLSSCGLKRPLPDGPILPRQMTRMLGLRNGTFLSTCFFIVVVSKTTVTQIESKKDLYNWPGNCASWKRPGFISSFLRVCGMSEKTLDVKTVTCSHKAGWKRTCQIPIPPEERAHGVVETGLCLGPLFWSSCWFRGTFSLPSSEMEYKRDRQQEPPIDSWQGCKWMMVPKSLRMGHGLEITSTIWLLSVQAYMREVIWPSKPEHTSTPCATFCILRMTAALEIWNKCISPPRGEIQKEMQLQNQHLGWYKRDIYLYDTRYIYIYIICMYWKIYTYPKL